MQIRVRNWRIEVIENWKLTHVVKFVSIVHLRIHHGIVLISQNS